MGKRLNNVMFFLAGVLAVIIIGILVIGITTWAKNGSTGNQDYSSSSQSQETWKSENKKISGEMAQEKWQEGVIEYQGKNYTYNKNLKIYLLMGIDRSGTVEASEDFTKGGQSDAMFLLVANQETQEMSVVSINRNTMVDVYTCDENGNSLGTIRSQLCVQHGFGDGKKLSCTRTVDAVEKLFYNVPISGYISINMDAISQINSVVGGVTVEVLEDMKSGSISLKKGEEVTLTDEEAYLYLRGRDMSEKGSATARLRRQEQFITSFIKQVKESQGITSTKVESLYERISDYLVSSVDFTSLVSAMLEYDFDESNMYTVPGELKMGEKFEEFIVDEDAFYDQVINVFYQEVGGA